MKSPIKPSLFFFLFICFFYSTVQSQSLFNDKIEVKSMAARWELDSTSTKGTFLLTPYKSIYILPFVWTSSINEQPQSGNNAPDYVQPHKTDYDNIEMRFQLSFKTKILQRFLWGSADLWVAYTQISQWQIYNSELSRPFRETNYEPEIIVNFPVKFNLLGFKTRMFGLTFNHQSNGQSLPNSRSWNRVILLTGFERKNWSIYLRPWYVIPESKGDNPDISDYMGNGDLNVIYSKNGNVFSFIGSNNFNFEGNMRGSAIFSYAYPIKRNLKGYLQISHGYGNTLLDYNHNQTTIGVGISLTEWQ